MNYTKEEIDDKLTNRTYSQVTCTIPTKAYYKIVKSHWFDTSGLKIELIENAEEKEFTMVKIFGHGLGKNLFQKKLVVGITLSLTD